MSCGQEVLKTMQFKSEQDALKSQVYFFKKWTGGGEMKEWLLNGHKVSVTQDE